MVRLSPARRRVAGRALAIGLSLIPFGLSFGALSVSSGLTVLQASLLSAVLFSGASQFALVSILGGGGGAVAAVGTALLLGVRNTLYGARVGALLRPWGWRRALAAQTTIDETTAMIVAEAETTEKDFAYWVTAASVFGFWNASTLAGALAGHGLGDPATMGLDAAGPAAFVALLAPRLRRRRYQPVAVLATVIAVAAVSFLPAGSPVLLATVAAFLALRRGAPS